jgi:hypothetical protein
VRAATSPALGVVVMTLFTVGCGDESQITCPQGLCAAINVDVRDSVSDTPLWYGTSGEVRDGEFQDSLHARSDDPADSVSYLPMWAAWERPGHYSVLVSRPGYGIWQAETVVTRRSGPCAMLVPVRLRALLVMEP